MKSHGENSRHYSESITSRDELSERSVEHEGATPHESAESIERSLPSHDERILSDRPPESDDMLGGGVNETRLLSLKDDGKCVFKPKEGERRGVEYYDDRSGYKRERAAYLVDKFLGTGLVPPTVIREVNGQKGSAQRFIPDTVAPWEILDDCPEEKLQNLRMELFKMFILDYVTLNSDRHAGNALMSKDYSKLHAIDNGYCFAFRNIRFTDAYLKFIKDQVIPEETKEMVRQILDNEPLKSVLKELLLELLPEDQAEACIQRIEYLKMLILDATVLDMQMVRQLTYFTDR